MLEIVEDDNQVFLRALGPGVVCVSATTSTGLAKAPVTVLSTDDVPFGTPRWTIGKVHASEDASLSETVALQSDEPEGAALIAIEREEIGAPGVSVRALDQDGLERWRRDIDGIVNVFAGSFGDDDGGIVLQTTMQVQRPPSTLIRLDGATGNESWRYSPPNGGFLRSPTVRPGNTLVAFEGTYQSASGLEVATFDLVVVDLATGQVTGRHALPTTFSVERLAPFMSGLITAEDGAVYGTLGISTDEFNGTTWQNSAELKLLKLTSDGSLIQQTITSAIVGGPAWNGLSYVPGEVISNGQGAVAVAWLDGQTFSQSRALVSTGGVSSWAADARIETIDGLGYAYGQTVNGDVARRDPVTGAQVWAVSHEQGLSIVSTLADGGVFARDGLGQLHRYDPAGNEIGTATDPISSGAPTIIGDELLSVTSDRITAHAVDDALGGLWQVPGLGQPAAASGPGSAAAGGVLQSDARKHRVAAAAECHGVPGHRVELRAEKLCAARGRSWRRAVLI